MTTTIVLNGVDYVWGESTTGICLRKAGRQKAQVGATKTVNGKTYYLNDNRRWALKREGNTQPKAKKKADKTVQPKPKKAAKPAYNGRASTDEGELLLEWSGVFPSEAPPVPELTKQFAAGAHNWVPAMVVGGRPIGNGSKQLISSANAAGDKARLWAVHVPDSPEQIKAAAVLQVPDKQPLPFQTESDRASLEHVRRKSVTDIGQYYLLYADHLIDPDPGQHQGTPEQMQQAVAAVKAAGGSLYPVLVQKIGRNQHQVVGNHFAYEAQKRAGMERMWTIIVGEGDGGGQPKPKLQAVEGGGQSSGRSEFAKPVQQLLQAKQGTDAAMGRMMEKKYGKNKKPKAEKVPIAQIHKEVKAMSKQVSPEVLEQLKAESRKGNRLYARPLHEKLKAAIGQGGQPNQGDLASGKVRQLKPKAKPQAAKENLAQQIQAPNSIVYVDEDSPTDIVVTSPENKMRTEAQFASQGREMQMFGRQHKTFLAEYANLLAGGKPSPMSLISPSNLSLADAISTPGARVFVSAETPGKFAVAEPGDAGYRRLSAQLANADEDYIELSRQQFGVVREYLNVHKAKQSPARQTPGTVTQLKPKAKQGKLEAINGGGQSSGRSEFAKPAQQLLQAKQGTDAAMGRMMETKAKIDKKYGKKKPKATSEESMEDRAARIREQVDNEIVNQKQMRVDSETSGAKTIQDWLKPENFAASKFSDFNVPPEAFKDEDAANAFYKKLAREIHPDRGGTTDQMASLNALRGQILALVEMNGGLNEQKSLKPKQKAKVKQPKPKAKIDKK